MVLAGLFASGGCAAVSGVSTGPPSDSFGDDASLGDGGALLTADAASSCHPSAVLTYVPSTYRTAEAPSTACLGADGGSTVEDFFDACLGPNKSTDACNDYNAVPSNAACAACVLTPYNADRLGPILDYGEFVGGNVAGCIERTAPADLSCARAVQALTDCEVAACQANCPVADTTSLTAREACSTAADANGCSSYLAVAAACRSTEADAGLALPCTNVAFKDFFDAVVPYFCGVAPLDASAPSDAASGDAALELLTDGGAHGNQPAVLDARAD
jgi:hypothetical protein